MFVIEAPAAGQRLDVFLASRLPLSRARLQALIDGGHVWIDPVTVAAGARESLPRPPAVERLRAARRLRKGERVHVQIPAATPATLRPESIPLDVVYEDADLLVVNKPAGMTVHPGAGRSSGTLVHAILAHSPVLQGIGGEERPGIVHRLDKDTSGLLVVAKSDAALRGLAAQIQARRMHREYLVLVWGRLAREQQTVDAPVGRHPRHRTRMAIVATGRRAVTHLRVVERFEEATLLEARLETGRTHQIRVHCAAIGHPVVGDPVYGRRPASMGIRRQALHAARLAFAHPVTGRPMAFAAPLPSDFAGVLEGLRGASGDAARHA